MREDMREDMRMRLLMSLSISLQTFNSMAALMALERLRAHPELLPLILHDVKLTGKNIGAGAFGSVEEAAIPGALCAAKKIHEYTEKEWVDKVRKIVAECKMIGALRHPNIVQFLGLWFYTDSRSKSLTERLYLLMEKMTMNLHNLLVPQDKLDCSSHSQSCIPLSLKYSILQDIARGLAFLHKQKPPIVHGGLSARNVLLNSAMVAKIADVGMAQLKSNATITKELAALVYASPESPDDKHSLNSSIDLFSLGVIAIFLLAQEFPNNLKASYYTDGVRGLMARTELERREEYTKMIYCDFPKTHPLVQLMESCLQNRPEDRPSIDQALELLGQAVAEIKDEYTYTQFNKLQLLQVIEQQAEQEQQKCDAWREEVEKLSPLRDEVAQLRQENARLQQMSEDMAGQFSSAREKVEQKEKEAWKLRIHEGELKEKNKKRRQYVNTLENQEREITRQQKETKPVRVIKEVSSLSSDPATNNTDTQSLSAVSESTYFQRPIITTADTTPSQYQWLCGREETKMQDRAQNDTTDGPGMGENSLLRRKERGRADLVFKLECDKSVITLPQSLKPTFDNASKPHKRIESWLMNVDRNCAAELLMGCKDGTFLCRPTSTQTTLPNGGTHTHTIDVMYGDLQHVKVYRCEGRYGITPPCTFRSLMDLVLYHSEHSLSTNNSALFTKLQFPVH